MVGARERRRFELATGSFYQPFHLPAEILDVLFQGFRRSLAPPADGRHHFHMSRRARSC